MSCKERSIWTEQLKDARNAGRKLAGWLHERQLKRNIRDLERQKRLQDAVEAMVREKENA